MKKAFLFLFLMIPVIEVSYADTWGLPVEKDYYSENRLFIAHVTPAKEQTKAKLEIFAIKVEEKKTWWKCALGNEGAPQEVFVSDNGEYVVTVNEVNSRVHGGMGDYVLAFYNRDGLIRNYSLEQLINPNQFDYFGFSKLVRRSASGRSWACRPMFFDNYKGKMYFCVWLIYGHRWLGWEVGSGEEVEINNKLEKRWNEKGRLWACDEGIKSRYWKSALMFLGKVGLKEDRENIAELLSDSSFRTTSKSTKIREFEYYYSYSPKRSLADLALARVDGKTTEELKRSSQKDWKYYFLGVARGIVKLPRPPKEGDNYLCIYLVPSTVDRKKWYETVPVHRLTAYFWKYSFHNSEWPDSEIPFSIHGVTPGEYYVKVVWDKSKPYNFSQNHIKGPPQQGDYQNIECPMINIKAGEIVDNVIVDCTQEVEIGS